MVSEIRSYRCEICGGLFESKDMALSCEKKEVGPKTFQEGESVKLRSEFTGALSHNTYLITKFVEIEEKTHNNVYCVTHPIVKKKVKVPDRLLVPADQI